MVNGGIMETELCVGCTQFTVLTLVLIIVGGLSLNLQQNIWIIY